LKCKLQLNNLKRLILASKKSYPLRINPDVLAAVQRWADDDLRSVNAQIEYILRDALVKSGRVKIVQKVVTEVHPQDPEE
jgi:hypothetical protein